MEEGFQVYYCTVCNICKKPSESPKSMKFCSGCKLIQYCSAEHQKQDWPNHREVCKGVQYLTKRMGIRHIYEEASSIPTENLTHWVSLRSSVAQLLKVGLKRALTISETQMILFPPVCNYCHLYKVNEMFICHSCKSVLYCSKEHQFEDEKHLSLCNLYFLSFQVDMLRFHEQTAIFNFLRFAAQCSVKTLSINMETFIKSQDTSLTPNGICISEPLSFTLTFIFVISKVAKISANQLTIHVLGADSMELLAMQTFPLIYHLLPHIMHVKIVLVGPKLHDDDSIPLCIAGESNISVSSVSSLYHKYVDSPNFVAPDIIAVFNCGFCEFVSDPARDTWKESLSCILSFNNTIVTITSYTESESVADIKRLLSLRRKDITYTTIMECEQNPFCSLYPHRDWENGEVYFANKYISVIRT